ncbi:MAG: hypothetical protein H5U40_06360 [Polyangiaceae bacterium]|nr:hypothetical protein [Polyangiaceae bacterium]
MRCDSLARAASFLAAALFAVLARELFFAGAEPERALFFAEVPAFGVFPFAALLLFALFFAGAAFLAAPFLGPLFLGALFLGALFLGALLLAALFLGALLLFALFFAGVAFFAALFFGALFFAPFAGSSTPARRALSRPIATVCSFDFEPYFPRFTCSISSRTNAPAWVVAGLPSRLSFRARSIVFF